MLLEQNQKLALSMMSQKFMCKLDNFVRNRNILLMLQKINSLSHTISEKFGGCVGGNCNLLGCQKL